MTKNFLMALALVSTCFSQGYTPKYTTKDQIVRHMAYTLKYSELHEEPSWVYYKLTNKMVKGASERTNNFKSDPLVKTGSATPDDYVKSGYDRGHICPAGDMSWSDSAMAESFYMSNMTPQKPGFNRGIWKKLEEQVRNWAKRDTTLYVTAGPVLSGNLSKIGKGVSVPKYFYKVIFVLKGKNSKGIGFIMPNEDSDKPLQSYCVTIDSVESIAKLDFFNSIVNSIETPVEKRMDIKEWFN